MTTTEEKIAVMQAHLRGEKIEILTAGHDWQAVSNPQWDWYNNLYRVKPADPMVIPWELISPQFKWAAKDRDGSVFAYKEKPHTGENFWQVSEKHMYVNLEVLVGVKAGKVPWHQSLIQRPE